MLIFTKIAELQAFIHGIKASREKLGFVPTMGALHNGHISLIQISRKECDVTICSIFVNPTQFNDKKDLERYPRMPEQDIKLLEDAGCNAVFLPSVEEMYPGGNTNASETFNFGYLDKILEGKHRPGHFNGVAQVVKRFFEIINPDKAFFGSKDYQQVMIVMALVKQMHSPITVIACPILREPDGLAMSSRNALLSSEERIIAGLIPQMMQDAKRITLQNGIDAARLFIEKEVYKQPFMKLDYFEVCDAESLELISRLNESERHVAVIACFVGKIRLIDNLVF